VKSRETHRKEKKEGNLQFTQRAFPLNAIQDKQYLKHPRKQTAKAPAVLNNIYIPATANKT
jgi:hypothetical protein